MTLGRFFRTPKGVLILALGALAVLATVGQGVRLVAPDLLVGVGVAMAIDVAMLRWRKGRWIFPDGALLTGLIVAMVLSPREPWHVVAVTSAIGVVSKYVARIGTANVFNPAALALVSTFYIYDTAQNWWGALPELSPYAIIALFAAGIIVARTVDKLPVVVAFLGAYYALITIAAFGGDPARVAELYRAPDLNAALFFAFFMITDPPTSPPKARDQVIYGVIVAAVSFAAFETIGAVYFLLAGVLVANVWEAWRRARAKDAKTRAAETSTRPA